MEKVNEPSQQEEQTDEMTLLAHRMALEERIQHGILKLLLCNIDELSARFILELQKDLEEWLGDPIT